MRGMDAIPTPEQIHQRIGALDDRGRRIVGSLTVLLISEPQRARDQEWLAERFTQLTVVGHGFDEESPSEDEVAVVERYVRAHIGEHVGLSLAVFVRIAEDLKDAGGEPPYGLDDSFGRVKGYVGDFDIRPPDA